MTIKYNVENEDIVDSVTLTTSPAEYLTINAALKYFIENSNYHNKEVELAKQMRKVIKNHGNDD